jgi:hypothetical protein
MAEFTEQIFDIIEKKDSAINTGESKLLEQLGPTEKLIFADIKKLIDKFNVSGGKIEFNESNVELVNQINQTIVDAIQKSKMPGTIREFLRDFDTIKEFNVDVHSKLNGLSTKELEDLINPIQRGVVQQTLDGLTGAGVDANFIEPVKQGIYKNIVGGATRSDLENFLRAYVVGTPELNGLYSRYVKQVSRDALGQFDGQINAKIAEEFGLDAFRYVGSIIDDSRAQCVRWVGKRILEKSEMESEINWANNNGSGMIPGTNPDNFLIYRGGYNCRHRAIPFKLTKSQRERLQKEQTTEATTEKIKFEPDKSLNDALKRAEQNGFAVYHSGDNLKNKIIETQMFGETFGKTIDEQKNEIQKLFRENKINELDEKTKLQIVNSANEFYFNNPKLKKIDLVLFDSESINNVAQYEPISDSIVYPNKKNLIDFTKDKTEKIDSTNVGFASDKYENKFLGVYSHEYAHFYDLRDLPREKRLSTNINAYNNNKKFFDENYKKIESLISIYGADEFKATEFIAELWATKWNPQYDLLPDETKSFIESIIKTFGSLNENSLEDWRKLII